MVSTQNNFDDDKDNPKDQNLQNNKKIKGNKKVLIPLTILSILILIFGFFWIPILSSFNVDLTYNIFVWFSPLIAGVSAIPLAICYKLLFDK